jgi:hypothetical protein
MDNQTKSKKATCDEYLNELLSVLSDPLHKRLVKAYQEDDPVHSMESELAKIIMEILNRED